MNLHVIKTTYKSLILLSLFFFISNMVFAEGFNTPYELSAAGEGKAGYYLVEVSAYVTKKKDINIEITKQCAIHGVLFKGYSGNNGYASKPPIIEDKNININNIPNLNSSNIGISTSNEEPLPESKNILPIINMIKNLTIGLNELGYKINVTENDSATSYNINIEVEK